MYLSLSDEQNQGICQAPPKHGLAFIATIEVPQKKNGEINRSRDPNWLKVTPGVTEEEP